MIVIPFLNPITYHEENRVPSPHFVSKHFEDAPFEDTIPEGWEPVMYAQPWQKSEIVSQFIYADIFPVTLQVLDCHGVVVQSSNFQVAQRNRREPTMFICVHQLSLAGFSEGVYRFRIISGDKSFISGKQMVKNRIDNSLYLAYKHHRFYGDVIFETGYSPTIRVEGSLTYKTPASTDTIYEDSRANVQLIQSTPHRVWELLLNDAFGIPDYLIEKYNWILGCSSLQINDRFYSKASEGGRLEKREIELYSLRGWSIELRERHNHSSMRAQTSGSLNGRLTIVAASDSKGFGDGAGQTPVILDVE